MEFFDTIRQVKNNWQPYKVWELEQRKKEKQNEELRKKYPPTPEELAYAKQYGRTIVDAINTMDQHSIDKSEDANLVISNYTTAISIMTVLSGVGLGALLKRSNIGKKLPNLKPYWEILGLIVATSVVSPIVNIWRSKVTKQASRIARFQAREHDLKDYNNFIVYDEKQINEAEKIAKSLPDIQEKRKDVITKKDFNPIQSYKDAKKTTENLKNDEEKYLEWKKEYLKAEEKKKEEFKNINPSKGDLNKAQKDKEVMLNTIRKIENMSLEYSNNMEMATFILAAIIVTAGTAVGGGMAAVIHKLQKYNVISGKYNKSLSVLKALLVTIIPGIATMVALGPTIKLVKDSARIGRFKAKQEFLKDPQNFIAYDDEQRKNIDSKINIKQLNIGFWERFKDDLSAIKKLKNDFAEYKTYMDTKHKDELKLKEALKQVMITNSQKQEAINLQKQAFYSFEKIDEKAQRFTDDADAAIDAGNTITAGTMNLMMKLIPAYLFGKEIKELNKGKTPQNIIEVLQLAFSGKLKGKLLAIMLAPFILPKFVAYGLVINGVQIKKDAGKIGVMTAMQDLDNPKNFLKENS